MHVQSTRLARIRAFEVTPALFLKLALAAAAALYIIVATGATVRLTASGLGCEHWPGCTSSDPFPAKNYHAFIEFGNRLVGAITIGLTLVTWLAARRTPGLSRRAVRLSSAVFWGTLAQAPLGAITIKLDLHPLLVLSHLLLSLVVLGGGTIVALEAFGLIGGVARPFLPLEVRRLGLVLAGSCLALLVTGMFVTAAGPHSGGSDIRRLGTVSHAIYVHVRMTALFGCAFLFILGYLAARRERSRFLFRSMLGLLALLLVQMGVGEIQYRTDLPWWLVLAHVSLAAAVWAWTVALVFQFWRPLAVVAPDSA
jgi:cytochrome c oxidase assembly protein subunit 15